MSSDTITHEKRAEVDDHHGWTNQEEEELESTLILLIIDLFLHTPRAKFGSDAI